jgi:hypothetical protein
MEGFDRKRLGFRVGHPELCGKSLGVRAARIRAARRKGHGFHHVPMGLHPSSFQVLALP